MRQPSSETLSPSFDSILIMMLHIFQNRVHSCQGSVNCVNNSLSHYSQTYSVQENRQGCVFWLFGFTVHFVGPLSLQSLKEQKHSFLFQQLLVMLQKEQLVQCAELASTELVSIFQTHSDEK